ncbi:ECF transporter S component, partial [Saccharothrix longispora]|nr:ECF transporter S component [Saccharothrix longispora]
MNALRVRPRAAVALAVAAAISVVAFGWPLLVSADAGIARGAEAPWVFALLLPLVLAVVLAELSEGGLDAKAVAVLGVLSALGAAIRPLGAGTAGIETVFFLLVLGGRV